MTILDETVEIKESSIIYEQDLRAGSHSNGRAPHLLDLEEVTDNDGGTPPPEYPDEPEYHKPEQPGEKNSLLQYSLAFVYLGAACLSAYVGISMIRDLRTNTKKEKK
jgi:hypothetical protein